MLKKEQIEFLNKLSLEDRKILAEIIKDAKKEFDSIGCDSDGGSVWGESASETLSSLAYKIEHYDSKDVHWE